jgi:hypothetical protein
MTDSSAKLRNFFDMANGCFWGGDWGVIWCGVPLVEAL